MASRTLAILFAFDEHHRHLSLSDLARRSDLPLATAHRLVAELAASGALVRRPDGRYVVGRRLWDVGLLAPVQTGLREAASPFLNDIHAATLATVHLAIRDRSQVLYVERVSGRTSVPVVSSVGSRLPMHSTAVGKVLLAYAPRDVQRQVLSSLTRLTPYTVTSPPRLRRQLDKVRADGYATTVEEMTLGASSIAVPVRGRDDTVIAAIGIVASTLRRDRGRYLSALQVAAKGIGRHLSD